MLTRKQIVDNFIVMCERMRAERNLSQAKMASILDMSTSSYFKMINGDLNSITAHTVYRLHKLTHIPMAVLIGEIDTDTTIRKMMEDISDTQKRFVKTMIEMEYYTACKYDGDGNFVNMIIPTGEMIDGMNYDSCRIEKINIGPYYSQYKDSLICALKITNLSFFPTYIDGDVLLIGNDHQPRTNQIGLLVNRGKVYLRQVTVNDVVSLEPVCGVGKTIFITREELKEWHTIGYVLQKMRLITSESVPQ